MKGVTLHSQRRGDGSPLLLLHGLFGDGANLGKLATALAAHYAVHTLDLRNHGRSPHSEHMDYPTMAEDVLSYVDAQQLDRVAIIGHSMGGKVAMQCALSFPDRVHTIVVGDIAPIDYPPHHDAIFTGLQQLDLNGIRSRGEADQALSRYIDDAAVRQFILKSLVNDRESGGYRWRINVPAIVANYANILAAPGSTQDASFPRPVLFIRGELSDYIQAQHREQTVQLFPQADLKTIAGASHWLHAEKPDTFNRLCQRFLEQHYAPSARGH